LEIADQSMVRDRRISAHRDLLQACVIPRRDAAANGEATALRSRARRDGGDTLAREEQGGD
jgi:hypothetical protein